MWPLSVWQFSRRVIYLQDESQCDLYHLSYAISHAAQALDICTSSHSLRERQKHTSACWTSVLLICKICGVIMELHMILAYSYKDMRGFAVRSCRVCLFVCLVLHFIHRKSKERRKILLFFFALELD